MKVLLKNKIEKKLFRNALIVICLFIFGCFLSIHFALLPIADNSMSDFGAYYYAANIILDPSIPNETVYNINFFYDLPLRYGSDEMPMPFNYSIPAAYLMSPLALIPYEKAKLVMNCLSLFIYLASVIIILHLGRVSAERFLIGIAFSLAWLPFIDNQYYINTNAILFFLISLAVLMADKKRPKLYGILIAAASLFKIFPIAIAMVLGLKNWRIFITCVTCFILLIFISGSTEWFHAMTRFSPRYTAVFRWFGMPYFIFYILFIALVTAYISYRGRYFDYPLLVAFSVPAVFLTMPVFEYHHLTLLAFPFIYLIAFNNKLSKWFRAALYLSLITLIATFYFNDLSVLGVFILWVTLAVWIVINTSGHRPAVAVSEVPI